MRAILLSGDRRVQLGDIASPGPGVGEVRVKIKVSAICGTDLHYYREEVATRAGSAHFASGHEPVGEVESVGAGVVWPNVGDRVVVYHVVGCQQCDACRGGRFKECPSVFKQGAMGAVRNGANAEYIVVPARQCLPLPSTFTWEEGAILACNFGTAYGALRNARTFPGDTAVVWGLGPVGLCVVLIGRALGVRVVGLDISEGRRGLAKGLGGVVADPRDDSAMGSAIAELASDVGPAAVIDTSGAPMAHDQLLDTVQSRGRVVLVGFGMTSSLGPTRQVILKELSIVGSWIFELSDWPEMLRIAGLVQADLNKIVSEVATPDEAERCFAKADLANEGKILFRWA